MQGSDSKSTFRFPFFLALLLHMCYSYDNGYKIKENSMRNPALVEEMKTYKGRDEVPQDFDAFWDGEIDKVSVLQDYQLEERDFHIPNVKCYELTF